MLMTDKYEGKFLRFYDKNNDKKHILETFIDTEKETGKELLSWDNEQVNIFLKRINSKSPQTLNKAMVALRKFADFICKREKLSKREYPIDDGVFLGLIDREHLLSVTLSYQQYLTIKNQLNMEGMNVRDRLIFELAWVGLTAEEIKMLKVSDIEFTTSDIGLDVAILNLSSKVVRIEDSEIIEDIKLCSEEKYNMVVINETRVNKMLYKESEYLIKPINIGKGTEKTYLNNPEITFQNVIKKNNITCKGIDMSRLSLEDIRRSKLIYLLAPENKKFFDRKTVSGIFNFKAPTSLKWLEKIAEEKYPEEKKE